MTNEEFGAYLKELRTSKGLTLTALGDLIGYSNPYLSQIENGKKKGMPSPDLLNKLSKPLGVPYSDLMLKAGYYDEAMYRYSKDFEMYEDEMEAPPIKVLSLFIGGAGYIDPQFRIELFLILEDFMLGPDFERFNKEFKQYLINKEEAPESISGDYESELYEEFDSLYNAKNLLIQLNEYLSPSSKEHLLSALMELADKNNLSSQKKPISLDLTTLLQESSLTYKQKTLSHIDKQRILDMLEILFRDR